MCSLKNDQRAFFQEFIAEIEKDLCTALESNAARFPSHKILLSRFEEASKRLLGEGLKHLSQFIEFHNELCVAAILLKEPTCEQLDYEPEIDACKKRFDFCLRLASRKPKWVEVKTIHPSTKDDWKKYEQDSYLRRFGGVELIMEKEWLGGELYHKAYASRSKILEYVMQTENKIESCLRGKKEENTFLLFFSNGFDWSIGSLEDFVFFYRYDKHLPEDTFGFMEEHNVKEKGIILQRNIDFFAFMERPFAEIWPSRGIWNVRPSVPFEKIVT